MTSLLGKIVDVHCHVGLLGDTWPQWGRLSPRFLRSSSYPFFLAYARIDPKHVTDRVLREATERVLAESRVDHVVCLALDHVHDPGGTARPEQSTMWVANEYVLELRRSVGDKVLLGASVHPYARDFEDRVKALVDQGAVLLKWLPSAQDIDLTSERAMSALRALAHLGPHGNPLPLLLHIGGEYAVPPAGSDTPSLDFHSWSSWDRFWNFFRGRRRWRKRDVGRVQANLRAAVEEGAIIILAHAGLPYFSSGTAHDAFEHSDFEAVTDYLEFSAQLRTGGGRFLADMSALCTPFRQSFFPQLAKLPREHLLFGSDFPTPVFELSADRKEVWRDFKAVIKGHLDRAIIPQDNLLDVNLRELQATFGQDHPMFTNFGRLWEGIRNPATPPT